MTFPSMIASFNRTYRETGRRSGLEIKVEQDLIAAGLQTGQDYAYESCRIPYRTANRDTFYVPDFVLHRQGILIEAKGIFSKADRDKHLFIKQRYPDLDIRLVFSNPAARISPKLKMTYALWCKRHGFLCSKGNVPEEWLKHEPSERQRAALASVLGSRSA